MTRYNKGRFPYQWPARQRRVAGLCAGGPGATMPSLLVGPAELRPVGEVEFVQGLAAASASGIYGPSRAAAAIIGHADLKLGAKVAPVLEALQAASPNRFRGIRHNVTWSPDAAVDNRESE